jgi:PAS domain S-box-containing protein
MPDSSFLTAVSIGEATRHIQVYGLVLIDLNGMIRGWNVGATDLLGFTEAEALGRHFDFIFTGEDRDLDVPAAEMRTALARGHCYDDRWHLKSDGSRLYVNGGLCLLRNDGGDIFGFIKIIRDQTEKKERVDHIEQLNARLKEAHRELQDYATHLASRVEERTRELHERNAELEAFCYSIAHDLRAPLRGIQAMSQIALEDYGGALDETCRGYLTRIARAGQRMDQLTLDLLRYSRLSREQIELAPVPLARVVEEIVAPLQATLDARGGKVTIAAPLPAVVGQHAYVVQILSNFVSNAVKFVAPEVKPDVEIRAETRGDRVRIFVQDNGIGIPPEYRDKIFLLFERLHPEGEYEGTGVGLAIAHKAALRIHGTIGLEPRSPHGTVFWLDLPLAPDPAPAAA